MIYQCSFLTNAEESPASFMSSAQPRINVEATEVEISSDRISALENRVEHLNQMLQSFRSAAPGLENSQYRSEAAGLEPVPAKENAGQADEASTASSGYLSKQGGGKFRYVEAGFWANMCSEVAELDEILNGFGLHVGADDATTMFSTENFDESNISSSTISPTQDAPHARSRGSISESRPNLLKADRTASNAKKAFMKKLPSKDECDELLRWYFQGCHPIAPLVHTPTFWSRYEQFWQHYHSTGTMKDQNMSFASLMLALTYAGCVACPENQLAGFAYSKGMQNPSSFFQKLANTALGLSRFPQSPTLDTLRAYLICQSMEMKDEEPLSNIAFIGMTLRLANMLGLHKDPTHFNSFTLIESEERRRTWHHLVHVDVTVAVAAGLPPLIDLHSWNVNELSELEDRYIVSTEQDKDEEALRLKLSTAGMLVCGKLRFSSTLFHLES